MMITCTACGCDIPEPLYEFGPPKLPMCFDCFYAIVSGDTRHLIEEVPIIDGETGKQIGVEQQLTVVGAYFYYMDEGTVLDDEFPPYLLNPPSLYHGMNEELYQTKRRQPICPKGQRKLRVS